jgi:tetratricopeptide (TPR) repeat protein
MALTLNNIAANAVTKKKAAPASKNGGSHGITLTTPNPTNPLEHNNRAVELGSKGLWTEAIKEHELALEGDPERTEFRINLSAAHLRYAQSLINKKDYYNAAIQLRGALYADPANMEADKLLDGLVEKAKGKNDLKTRLSLADDADIAGEYPIAIVEYRKCVSMDDSGPIRAKLGRVLLKKGKVVDGFAELKAAVNKSWTPAENNDLADCHRQLAEILKDFAYVARDNGRMNDALKRLDNAGIEYRRAVTLNPSNSDAIRGLVEVALEAVSIRPSFDNHLMLGGAYQMEGDYDRARMEYETCWKLDKNNPALLHARRSFHLAVVRYTQSPVILAATVQKVEDNLRQTPNDPELLYIYGRGKEAQGEPDQALKAYQAASAINPFIFPDLKDRIASLVGGGVAPAKALPGEPGVSTGAPGGKTTASASGSAGFQPASPSSQGTTPGNTTAGTTPGSAGFQPASASNAGTGSPTASTNNLTDYANIESKLRTNDLEESQKLAMALVEKDPHDAHGWLLLGRIQEKKNDLDQASVSYRQAAYLKDPEAKTALAQVDSSRVQPLMKEADEAAGQNNWVRAAASLKDAVTIAPNLSSVHRKLAEALIKLGDSKEAQRETKRADDLDKEK